MQEYTTQDQLTKSILNSEKQKSFEQYVSSLDSQATTAQVWSKLKSFTSSYRPHNYSIEENNQPILDNKRKADIFCTHYQTQCQHQLDDNLFSSDIKRAEDLPTEQRFYSPFIREELEVAMNRIKNTSPGHDSISNQMIKSLHHNYIEEILMLFNQSYCTGVMPRTWKMGQVIPILKANKPQSQVSSYRPITLLPCIGKLLERLVQRRLEFLLENGKLLQKEQYGFRPGKSTIDILNLITCNIKTGLQNKISSGVIYIDFKGAYDRIWRHGLLKKLTQLGICNSGLKWFHSYLTDRHIVVSVNGHDSQQEEIKAGVPQGAVLSPALFNIMMRDFPQMDEITCYTYADDVTICTSHTNTTIIQQRLQNYVTHLESWCNKWGFTISSEKNKSSIIH